MDTQTSSPVTMANASGNQVTAGSLQTSSSSQDKYTENSTDTSETKSTDDSQSNPAGGTTNPASDVWTSDYSENYGDNVKDTTQTGDLSQLQVTDPTTGVITRIDTGDKTKAVSNDQYGDQTTDDQGGNTANGGTPTDNFNDNQTDKAGDQVTDRGTENIAVNGSPQAGTTESSSANLILNDSSKDGEQSQDNFTAPTTDAGNVEFQTSADDSVGGKSSTTITNTVNTNDGQGNTANSSVTLTDKGTIGGKDHNDDNGGDNFSDTNGTPATDNESDTDNSNALAQVSDNVGDRYNGTYGSFDPATGLATNTTVQGNDQTNESDTEIDKGTDIHGQSGTGTPVVTDNVTFDAQNNQQGGSTDFEKVVATTQGTDLQGEQVNVQATITNNANGTNSLSDQDDGADNVSSATGDTGGDTEKLHADVQFNGTIVQTLTGTIISTDPTTGIKTTTTENDSDTNASSLHDQENETDIRTRTPAGETDNDTATQTDTNTQTENWTDSETIAPSNGTPTTTTNTGGNTLNSSVGLQYAPDGTQTSTATGTETGSNNSSDPTVGTTTWTNQPVDSTRLNDFTSNASRLTNLAPPAGTGGTNSGTTPQAPMASGANAAQAAADEAVKNGGNEQEQTQAKLSQANNPAIADTKNAAQKESSSFWWLMRNSKALTSSASVLPTRPVGPLQLEKERDAETAFFNTLEDTSAILGNAGTNLTIYAVLDTYTLGLYHQYSSTMMLGSWWTWANSPAPPRVKWVQDERTFGAVRPITVDGNGNFLFNGINSAVTGPQYENYERDMWNWSFNSRRGTGLSPSQHRWLLFSNEFFLSMIAGAATPAPKAPEWQWRPRPLGQAELRYSWDIFEGRRIFRRIDDFDLGVPVNVDPKYVHPAIRQKIKDGWSNADLMQNGNAPIGVDGMQINLHHILGNEPGPMAEMTGSSHRYYNETLHGLIEDGNSFRNSRELNNQYESFRLRYWKWRLDQLQQQGF